ncbi:MAG: helix-turn-helix transcriptional regulator [Clostridia bacterium]|nr:helix-turn-helix transcriptional regulator [Clostridia bacterium]
MEQNVNKVISQNLIKLRKSSKLTQLELAKKFNFSDKTISKWESGESLPSIDVLVKICDFYGITLNDLINPELSIVPNLKNDISKESKVNRILITLLAITLVWIVATIVYIYAELYTNSNLWMSFIWAVPASFLFAIVANALWGNKKIGIVLISLFIWTLLTAVYLHMIQFNIWMVFILGVPAQIAAILAMRLKLPAKK